MQYSVVSRRRSRTVTLAIAAAAAALAVATSSADATVGSFSTTGSMNERRQAAVVVKLLDGRVLVAGGDKDEVGGGTTFLDSAEIYDPATGTFTPTGNMTVARSMAAGVLLPNGKVFITGGRDTPSGAVNTSELYNPATGTFTAVPGTMPTATGLWTMAAPTSGGKVLIVGGFASSADIYDPTTNSYTASGSMGSSYPTGTLSDLGSGKALIQGGFGGGPAKVFDISTGLFSSPANATTAIRSFPATALLASGKLLLAGGKDFGAGGSPVIAGSQLFDPATNLFSTTGSLIDAREQAFSSILGDGKVLVAGGTDGYYGTPKASAELYDPATGTFSTTGSMAVAHGSMHGNTAVLLDNCDVLLPGGWQGTSAPVGSRVIASAEIYDGPAGNCSSSGPTPGPTPGPGPAPDPAPEPSPSSEPAPGPSPSPRPSNAFTLGGGATRTSNRAIITRVTVPGPGRIVQLALLGAGSSRARAAATVCSATRTATRAGTYSVTCRLTAAARRAQLRGKVRLSLRTSFTPTGGTARTVSRTVVLPSRKASFTG